MAIPMGVNVRTGEHIYLAAFIHAIVFGRTGCGKSSLIADRVMQAKVFSDDTLILFDGGEDPYLFNRMLLLCHAAGRQLVLLSDRPELRNSKIDPFRAGGELPLLDAVNLVVASAGIDASMEYGKFYFWISAVQGLLAVWRAMERRAIPIALDTTVNFINNQRQRRGKDDTLQLKYVISLLLEYRHVIQMDVDPSEVGFVRWREIEESATVVYVAFDQMDSSSVIFANIILQSYLAYKRASTVRGENDFDAAILIDEFQRVVGKPLAENTTGMRKHRVTFYLLAQSPAQIEIVSPSLSRILLDQMAIQLFMSPESREEQEYIQGYSEEVIRRLGSTTRSFTNPTTGEREFITRRLTINEIRVAARTPGCAILIDQTKVPIEEPAIIYLEHLLTKDTFDFLSSLPFPKKLPALQAQALEPDDQAPRMEDLFNQVTGWLNGD